MHNHTTLFLLQSDHAQSPNKILDLIQLYSPQDSVVVMGDAVLHLNHPQLLEIDQCYMLQTDSDLLIQAPPPNIKIIDYAQFAQLVLQFNRCISIK